MATMKGRDAVSRYIDRIPEALRTKILRGAARAAAVVVANEAKARSISDLVVQAVKVSTRQERDTNRVIAKVKVKGKGAYIGLWLEHGTDPHFISVDPVQSGGRTARRVNTLAREGSLVINGAHVAGTVWHPGAKPHPFLRPAFDVKQGEAIAAAQSYINARLAREGLGGPEVSEIEE